MIEVPILRDHDMTEQIGTMKIKDCVLEDSCFGIGYTKDKNGKIILLEVSLVSDKNYKKFLDKKYEYKKN